MVKSTYALLIGINEYNHHKVTNLKGCVNDVKNVKAYLEKRFENPQIKTLLNEEATYQNIIDTFRSHLTAQAGKDDVVLFHYSGHGAREAAAREFKPFFPEGKEETLVCYDSRQDGGHDLADKELAVLISEVAATGAHVVLLLDCCHSGSGTRDTDDFYLGASRRTYHRALPRPIDTYIDGFYKKQLEELGEVIIPSSKHVLLAACDRTESARETSINTGVFTTTLLNTLKKVGNDISYANLFLKCRTEIINEALDQTPQFDSYNHFNAHSKFLDGTDLMDINQREITFEDGNWVMKAGVIDGIEITADCTPTFEIYKQGEEPEFLGFAEAKDVFPERTHLKLDFNIRSFSGLFAKPLSMPISKHFVYLHGDEESIQQFLATENDFIRIEFIRSIEKTKYNVEVQKHGIYVYFNHTNQLIQGYATPNFNDNVKFTLSLLTYILRWESAQTVQNRNTKLSHAKIDFLLTDEKGNRISSNETPSKKGQEGENFITLYLDEEDFDPTAIDGAGIKEVLVKARHFYQQELHFALVYFSEEFQIKVYRNEPAGKNQGLMTLWGEGEVVRLPNGEIEKHPQYLWLGREDFEYHDVFKLIVSTEPIYNAVLEQPPLKDMGEVWTDTKRRTSNNRNLNPLVNDWITKTIHVRLVKRQKAVSEEAIEVGGDNQIIIPGHPNFKAKLSLSTAQTNSRNADSLQTAAAVLSHQQGELLSFGSTNGNQENVLILSEIDADESLKEQPLELFIPQSLEADETIVSFTFDGEILIPVGTTSIEDGTTKITIDKVPDVSYPDQERSLKKALKLVFFKFIGLKSKLQQLRRVVYHSNGKAERISKGVANAVAQESTQNILLLIHGIIGDTEQMAEAFRPAIESGKYDLVLTYDYENLNTPIEQTAENLLSQLQNKLQLRFLQGKNLDIVAHSMGGLVSRYMIEQLKGDEIVRHLFMCGTPNGGSPIANVLEYRDLMITIMTIGANFGFSTPIAASVLAVLSHTKKLTVTLEQMDPDKEFIEKLSQTKQPKTQYTIIAGDLLAYRNKSDAYTKGIMNKALNAVSNLFHEDEHNDIAVSLDSIKSVNHFNQPPPRKLEVACHHMNYFTSDGAFETVCEELGVTV